MVMTRPREGLLIAAFAAIALLVGGNAVGIRFSNRELDPLEQVRRRQPARARTRTGRRSPA